MIGHRPFKHNHWLQLLIGLYIIDWAVMAISPTNRLQWLAENVLIVVAITFLAFTYRSARLSNRSYLLILIFLCLHTYAAHFTYEETPFDHWLKTKFHTHRSYYDRVVHLAFGLCWALPFREWLMSKLHIRGIWTYIMPAVVVLSFSGLFEIMEMLAALAGGKGGEARFIGLQGDVLDTQKDMSLGLIGGIIAMGILAWMLKAKPSREQQ
ncbi:DUF2238 domain-containing protein [Paenibacillus sp. MMS18-CY102]|uniref:DUF2238 domain-containing protein n=1 Tax=Paenibacillus sp. MMS18-CY102 TaxID=2682849 RepID=UPI0013666232|nr:DUF2238 domain-containing protein [Paenibacillus sp. MMS18-CY102]MWC28022.1 DUF2238 domain-containing protein [Paenibacillus sp. MMS18-CY102]